MERARRSELSSRAIGSIWLLKRLTPVSALILTILFSSGVVGVLRLLFEGAYYDRSLASLPGDCLLGAYLAIVAWVIRNKTIPYGVHASRFWHAAVAAVSLAVAMGLHARALSAGSGQETVANTYHNLVVLPVLSYLVVSAAPALFKTRVLKAKVFAAVFVAGWLALLLYDIVVGNLQENSTLQTTVCCVTGAAATAPRAAP
jgi:hypothetical protein